MNEIDWMAFIFWIGTIIFGATLFEPSQGAVVEFFRYLKKKIDRYLP